MTDGEPQQIPDLWVPLAKLAWWIRHVYDLEGGDVIRYVVLALRRGPHLRIVWPPPHGPKVVKGWEWDEIHRPNVTVNWGAGHLAIGDPDDPPEQFPIEAEWEAVIDAVSDWQRQQRNAGAYAARALALAPKPALTPGSQRLPHHPPCRHTEAQMTDTSKDYDRGFAAGFEYARMATLIHIDATAGELKQRVSQRLKEATAECAEDPHGLRQRLLKEWHANPPEPVRPTDDAGA